MESSTNAKTLSFARATLLALAIGGASFAVGFALKWSEVRGLRHELETTESELAEYRFMGRAVAARIAADRAEFEQARHLIAVAYTELDRFASERDETPFTQPSSLRLAGRERDQLITDLARGDSAALTRLELLYRPLFDAPDSLSVMDVRSPR